MAKSPAFQFYPKDWLSSRHIQVMTPEQEGAYVRLLCYCWDSGDCSLPDDDQELAILSRLGEGWFNGGSTVVRKCFVPHPEKTGHLTNDRLLAEHQKQAAWRSKSKEGGKRSASKRADKQEDSKGGSTTAQPEHLPPVEPKANITSSSAIANCVNDDDGKEDVNRVTRDDPPDPSHFGTAFHPRFSEVREYIVTRLPTLARQNATEVNRWLLEGADPEQDIFPNIDSAIEYKRGDIGSFRYFANPVLSAVKVRREQEETIERLRSKCREAN